MNLTRRKMLTATATTLAAPLLLGRNAWAQGKSLKIGIYAGSQGRLMEQSILPKFMEKFNCTVQSTQGASLAQIALLRTQKTAPQYSVMFMDDAVLPIAGAENLIAPISAELIPNLGKVREEGKFPRAVSFAMSACGVFYSPGVVDPLASYADLWDPKFNQALLTPSPVKTQSVYLTIMAAAVATGKPFAEAQHELDAAWPKLAEMKDNILSLYDNTSQIMLVTQDQAAYGFVETSKGVFPLIKQRIPIEMAYPREGTPLQVNTATLVQNAPEPELGAEFINFLLSDEIQREISESEWSAPSITGLTFEGETAKRVDLDAVHAASPLFVPDWEALAAKRAEIIEKLNITLKA